VAILGWLINGFAPLVSDLGWLKYLSLFYYYDGNDPLTQGVSIADIIVLGIVALLLTAVAAVAIEHRDLRA
jgi:ABC-2 type transport system permease protein